jgi:uncharacterized protein YjdB
MRTLFLAVTGVVFGVAACTSSGTSTLPVERTPVASVSITLPSPSIVVGQSEHGTATALDASGTPLTGRTISWATSSEAIARVDAAGMIAGVAPGSAMISAESEGVSAQASLAVMPAPPAPVASVSVALATGSLNPGQSTQATATTRDVANNVLTGRTIAWSSSDDAIATVNASGQVTAVALGSAQITATSEGKTGSATLTITSAPPVPVATVSVSLANSTRNPGETTQATATTRDANNNVLTGRSINWTTSNGSVATVSASGLVTAVAAGTAQITATSEGQSGSATLTVAVPPPVPVASVTVSLASSSLQPGQTTQASAVTRDANNNVLTGRTITWSSSNTGVATVSSNGLVTALAVGTVQILASCEGKADSATLSVSAPGPAPVATVTVSLVSSSLNPGLTTQATATTRDANNNVLTGRAITWGSTDSAVATVSATGLVTAVAVGNAQIIATSEGKSGSASLAVQAVGASHEPSGMNLISSRPFNALFTEGWDEPTNGQPQSNVTILSDPTAPRSPSNALRFIYRAGTSGGGATWDADSPPISYRTVYVHQWTRVSANWQGHPGSAINKMYYLYTSTDVPSIVIVLNGANADPLVPFIEGQNIVSGGQGSADPLNPDWGPNLGVAAAQTRVTRGEWFEIEVVAQMNTLGNADGFIDLWLNGVHITHVANVKFQNTPPTWRSLHHAPVWGGGGGTVANTMYMDFDHLYVSGKN